MQLTRFFPVHLLAATFAIVGFITTAADAEDWPEFRGPTQQGHATSAAATTWSESEHVAWKTGIPGHGHSSPIVIGGQVWITTALSDGLKKVIEEDSPIPREVADNLRLHAICLHRQTGKIIHDVKLFDIETPAPIHPMNSYASPTPVAESGRVYVHFGSDGTACVNTNDGSIVWQRSDMKLDHQTGSGSSPIIWNDLLIFHMDGCDKQYIVALNKNDGKTAWQTARTGKLAETVGMKKAFSMPLVMNIGGKDVLVSPAANWVYGYDAATGSELWKVDFEELGFSNSPRPVADENYLFVCTGFMKSQILAIKLDRSNTSSEPTVAWRFKKQVPSISSPLLVGKELYFIADQGGVMTCVDTESGEMLWHERLSGNHTASPVLSGGHIYVAGRDGTTTVIKPGREYKEVARNELASGIMASPAVADGALFVRTEEAVYCIK